MSKVAYITGGSKGIGLGIAESLLTEGYKVAITARTQKAIDAAVSELKKIGKGEVLGIQSNVRNYADEEYAIQQVLDKWGQLDVCIANAGVGKFASIDEMSTDDWNAVIDTNLTGVFHTVKASIPALKKSKGYIMTIASLAGTNFFQRGAAYNATYFNGRTPTEAESWKIQPEDIGQIVVDLLKMNPRTLPSKVEVRPTVPPSARKK